LAAKREPHPHRTGLWVGLAVNPNIHSCWPATLLALIRARAYIGLRRCSGHPFLLLGDHTEVGGDLAATLWGRPRAKNLHHRSP
jgi:hypothetical protein